MQQLFGVGPEFLCWYTSWFLRWCRYLLQADRGDLVWLWHGGLGYWCPFQVIKDQGEDWTSAFKGACSYPAMYSCARLLLSSRQIPQLPQQLPHLPQLPQQLPQLPQQPPTTTTRKLGLPTLHWWVLGRYDDDENCVYNSFFCVLYFSNWGDSLSCNLEHLQSWDFVMTVFLLCLALNCVSWWQDDDDGDDGDRATRIDSRKRLKNDDDHGYP